MGLMRLLIALVAGLLFGGGLTLSGMTDTAKVQGFLDLLGAWDPTLAFVMGGAIIPMAIAWRLTPRLQTPVLGGSFPEARETLLDQRLLLGSAFFGIGWALVGLCPGPAIAVLGFGGTSALLFFAAMVAGMLAHRVLPTPKALAT